MQEFILKLLKSKNPRLIAAGMLIVFGTIAWGTLLLTAKAYAFLQTYETKTEHDEDIEERVSQFRKDVEIAMLKNNKILIDEIERKHRHGY